jgi:hypothetical protein
VAPQSANCVRQPNSRGVSVAIIKLPTRSIARTVAVAVAVLGLMPAAGCSGGQGQELISSDVHQYSGLLWHGDSVYYFLRGQNDSDSPSVLMRVRAGHSPERVTVGYPDCQDSNGIDREPSDVVAISDHELGLVMFCGPSDDPDSAVFARWDFDSGQLAAVAKIDPYGGGVAWSTASDTVYFPASGCASHSLRAVGGQSSTCLGGPDALFPATAADGSVAYLTSRCGTDAAEPQLTFPTFAVCRRDSQGRESTVAGGVQGPAALTVHGDRIVVAGEVRGKSGVWLARAGRFKRLTRDSGYYRGAAFNADGTRLAIAVGDDGWLSMTWSVRVIAVPHS